MLKTKNNCNIYTGQVVYDDTGMYIVDNYRGDLVWLIELGDNGEPIKNSPQKMLTASEFSKMRAY